MLQVRLGEDSKTGKDVFVPLADVLPTVHPCDLVIGGWDISGLSLDAAMARAKVVDYDLQRQVAPLMADLTPLPSIVRVCGIEELQAYMLIVLPFVHRGEPGRAGRQSDDRRR